MRDRATLLTCASLAALLCAIGSDAVAHDAANHHHEKNHHPHPVRHPDARVRTGLRIAPVPLRTRGKNLERVALGSYLVNAVGGCNDCHTRPAYQPGGDPFQGEAEVVNTEQYLSGGRQFGPFTSTNLTPDEFGRPGGLTFEQFAHTLRSGRDPDNANRILQVMPWSVFGKMNDGDLRAIYEYLSAIPSLPDNPAPGP